MKRQGQREERPAADLTNPTKTEIAGFVVSAVVVIDHGRKQYADGGKHGPIHDPSRGPVEGYAVGAGRALAWHQQFTLEVTQDAEG